MGISNDRRIDPPASRLLTYGLAILAVGVAWVLANAPIFAQLPFATFLLALAVVSWCLGRGPALLAAVAACAVLSYYFLPPDHSFYVESPRNQIQLAVFGAAGLLMSSLAPWQARTNGSHAEKNGSLPSSANGSPKGDAPEVLRLWLGHLFDFARYRYFFSGCLKLVLQKKICPCCGAEDSTTIDRKLIYRLERCSRCAVRFRYPTDSAAEMRRYYEHEYRQKGLTTDLPDERELAQLLAVNFAGSSKDFAPLIELLRDLGVPTGARILDYGSSWGYCTYQLRRAGYVAEAFEISRPRAEFGRRLGVHIACELAALPGPFDAVYAGNVLEHLPNPLATLRELMALTRPGGFLIAHTPNGSDACLAAHPALYHSLWGLPHPMLLSDEFVAANLSAHPCLIGSGTNHGGTAGVRAWDRQSDLCGDMQQPELLLIVCNRAKHPSGTR